MNSISKKYQITLSIISEIVSSPSEKVWIEIDSQAVSIE